MSNDPSRKDNIESSLLRTIHNLRSLNEELKSDIARMAIEHQRARQEAELTIAELSHRLRQQIDNNVALYRDRMDLRNDLRTIHQLSQRSRAHDGQVQDSIGHEEEDDCM